MNTLQEIRKSEDRGNDFPDDGPIVLVNNKPTFNKKMNAFVLDFKGRVKEASVKNFQLIDRDHGSNSKILLQFGKVSKHKFNMDVRYPLTPMQAFLTCISTFDRPAG